METTAAKPVLEAVSISKSFGEKRVLADVSFSAEEGEFVCIVGPSGTGKTTLLRALSALGSIDSGEVRINGTQITRPPAELSVVFQDYSRSLMPWMRVGKNIELPLRRYKMPAAERAERSKEALRDVGLEHAEHLYPWEMSGGMQQRAAIARSLAYRPEVMIMDEPFASVDAQTRADLEDLMLDIRSRLGVTIVLVTHDIEEAVYLGDKVIVLSGKPASVSATVAVPLGRDRDQIATKSRPDYLELRATIHEMIMATASSSLPEPPSGAHLTGIGSR
jgi:NitT/TauT family transport system ATP-binding protein